jgi:hypothetical protein
MDRQRSDWSSDICLIDPATRMARARSAHALAASPDIRQRNGEKQWDEF